MPLYLSETYGFGVIEIAQYAAVPYIGAMFGAWFGGLLAQNRIKSGWSVNKTRKFVIGLGGAIMLVSLLATIKAATPLIAVSLMAAILFGFQTSVGNIQTLPSDMLGGNLLARWPVSPARQPNWRLSGSTLIPVITVNSYTRFAVGAGLAIFSVLSVWILCGHIQPLQPKQAASAE